MPKKIITINIDSELVDYHKKEAARQGRSFSNYINNLLNFPGYEKSTPPLALDSRKTSGTNRTVRNRVKSD